MVLSFDAALEGLGAADPATPGGMVGIVVRRANGVQLLFQLSTAAKFRQRLSESGNPIPYELAAAPLSVPVSFGRCIRGPV